MNDINLLPEELRGAEEKALAHAAGPIVPTSFYIPPKEPAPAVKANAPAFPRGEPAAPKVAQDAALKVDHKLIPPKLMTDKEAGLTASRHESLLARFLHKHNKGAILKNVAEKNHSSQIIKQSLDVNLIPEGADLLPIKKIYNRFLLFAAVGCLVLALVYFGLVFYIQKIASQNQTLATSLAAGEIKYNQLKQQEEELIAWLERMGLIKNLFAEHVYWTNFFNALQAVTIPSVYYKDIASSLGGEVVLNAVAESYLSAAKQYLAYQESTNIIKSAAISGLQTNETKGISFTVNLSFSPDVYKAVPK